MSCKPPNPLTLIRGNGAGGSGDVTGPASSTDNAVARFDGAGGKTLQDSAVTVSDAGVVEGATQLNVDNLRLDGNTLSSTDANGNINLTPNGTGQILVPDGTAAKPVLAFGAETDNGFYRATGNVTRWTPDGGSTFVDFRSNALATSGNGGTTFVAASSTQPSLCPDVVFDNNTGIGRAGADQLSVVAGGNEIARAEFSGAAKKIAFLDKVGTPAVAQTGGAATAGAAYGATEQAMLQAVYDALRTFGFLT